MMWMGCFPLRRRFIIVVVLERHPTTVSNSIISAIISVICDVVDTVTNNMSTMRDRA